MISAKQYTQQKPECCWLHSVDLVKHILQGDCNQTAYQDYTRETMYLNEFQEEMGELITPEEKTDWQKALHDTYRPTRRVTPIISDRGDFEVSAYLNGESKCFTEWRKVRHEKPGLTVFFEATVPAGERNLDNIQEAHKKVYEIALECQNIGRPCRVVWPFVIDIPELETAKNPKGRLRLYIVLKDFDEPIYPGIWGALKNNKSANSVINVVMDFLVGTRHMGNGTYGNIMKQPFKLSTDGIEKKDCVLMGKRYIDY